MTALTAPLVGPGAGVGAPDVELAALGWGPTQVAAWAGLAAGAANGVAGLEPGRVVAEERGSLHVATAVGEISATVAGRLRHAASLDPTALYPAVGDWVALASPGPGTSVVHAVLARTSAIIRRGPVDRGQPSQVLAANVDVVFVVMSLNTDFNLRRLERYIAVAWESGAVPVVLLSKADLAADAAGQRLAAGSAAPGVEVLLVSAVNGEGIASIRGHLGDGRTVVFIGSSGVGKSSLVNVLAGEPILAVAAIREDDGRGRHTTTRRQLLRLHDGLVIDTPGLRELALLDGDGLAETFAEIDAVAISCRFRDCRHASEPGCAVRAAIADGSLAADRFDAYRKLEREARRAELAGDAVARKAERRKWTAMVKGVERRMELKYGREP
jgi:ribosome biogenesis GTPase